MRLEPLELWLEPVPGPLRPQILAALRQHGEPLRWAITAVEASHSPGLTSAGALESTPFLGIDQAVGPSGLGAPTLASGPLDSARLSGADQDQAKVLDQASVLVDPIDLVQANLRVQTSNQGVGPGRLLLEAVMLR